MSRAYRPTRTCRTCAGISGYSTGIRHTADLTVGGCHARLSSPSRLLHQFRVRWSLRLYLAFCVSCVLAASNFPPPANAEPLHVHVPLSHREFIIEAANLAMLISKLCCDVTCTDRLHSRMMDHCTSFSVLRRPLAFASFIFFVFSIASLRACARFSSSALSAASFSSFAR